jgi:REP element-mobilizing transposase RayT
MTRSFTRLTYHCTFSTRDRVASLYDNMRPRLHAYIARLINNDGGFAREVGGMDDHVHILLDLPAIVPVADAMSRVKSRSSGWIHRQFEGLREFAWQTGYGAFSVSASMVPSVRRYIQEQKRHHRGVSFEDEFRGLLEKHGVKCEERYLF